MREATVGYLKRGCGDDQEILLGRRDTLFCNNIWIGPGGKMRKRETPLGALCREIREEVAVNVKKKTAVHFASMDFHFPWSGESRLEWRVHFFMVPDWEGIPKLVEGFSELDWFPLKSLPYERMNTDVKLWMPLCLNGVSRGRLMIGEVHYGDSGATTVDKLSLRFIEKPKKNAK